MPYPLGYRDRYVYIWVFKVFLKSFNYQEYKCFFIEKFLNGPRREKTCLRWCAKNKGVDQPVHPRYLISAFVIRLLECFISRLAMIEILIF